MFAHCKQKKSCQNESLLENWFVLICLFTQIFNPNIEWGEEYYYEYRSHKHWVLAPATSIPPIISILIIILRCVVMTVVIKIVKIVMHSITDIGKWYLCHPCLWHCHHHTIINTVTMNSRALIITTITIVMIIIVVIRSIFSHSALQHFPLLRSL